MSTVNTQANPYVYLHTHVKHDGSVILDLAEGTANKFAKVEEDCRELRANSQEVFRQFVHRASNYVALNWFWGQPIQPDGEISTTPVLKTARQCDPLKSPEVTALLTHEFRKTVAALDEPREDQTIVKRVSILNKSVVQLELADNKTQYRRFSSPVPILDLLFSFDHPEKTAEISQKISALMQQVVHRNISGFYHIRFKANNFCMLGECAFDQYFVGRVCRLNDRILKITDAGFVTHPMQNGTLFALFQVEYADEPSPSVEQMEEIFDLTKIDNIISGCTGIILKNLRGYKNVTINTIVNRSYERSPVIAAVKAPLVQLLEPHLLLYTFARRRVHHEYGTKLQELSPELRAQVDEDLIDEEVERLNMHISFGRLTARLLKQATPEQRQFIMADKAAQSMKVFLPDDRSSDRKDGT